MLKAVSALQLDNCPKESILNYFENAWELESILLKTIIGEDTFYHSPDKLRNPLIFYLGHCPAFYINKLIAVNLLEKRLNSDFELLFSVGVDPTTADELKTKTHNLKWPALTPVWQYRNQAHEVIKTLIENSVFNHPITPHDPMWALIMGIEHQRIHFETSSMLLRQLPVSHLQRPRDWHYAPSHGEIPVNRMIPIAGGDVEIGKPQDCALYGWDNEYGRRGVKVKPFRVSQYMITNGEFKKFVDEGGYENQDNWDEGSWRWKNAHNVKYPKFWLVDDYGNYQYRAMFDIMDLPLDWPVEVNHYEAMAYCRSQGEGVRLMGEAEWNLLVYGDGEKAVDDTDRYNLNLKFCSPSPVGMLSEAKNCQGIYDLRGNVWEWLGDNFNPFQGFEPHHLYKDYSAPYFDLEHKMLLGGAWVTHGTAALPYYRNWFRPNFYQHAGFRIAQDI
ncbi:MAG: Hercynine oxygenase [Chroococcopsis gigantea SAG 12.99]|jgi:5-histidylcysteine sulfoxide synthase|nr:5-histidylcysteine sulfoxide synthase [Chlorogloea purpurea SAG 13.99]MDV3001371.1 Hercynine oxygenase [Chroococcopsis gigantea SAG 12.99]